MTFICHQRIILVALKNMNNALKLDFINSNIYFHTLDESNVSIVCINEGKYKLPTMFWLPKLHRRPIKLDLLQILDLIDLCDMLNKRKIYR